MELTINFKKQTIESKNVPIKEMITIIDGVTIVLDIEKKIRPSHNLEEAFSHSKVKEFVKDFIDNNKTIAVYSVLYGGDDSIYVPSYIININDWILNMIKNHTNVTVSTVLNKEQGIASFILNSSQKTNYSIVDTKRDKKSGI